MGESLAKVKYGATGRFKGLRANRVTALSLSKKRLSRLVKQTRLTPDHPVNHDKESNDCEPGPMDLAPESLQNRPGPVQLSCVRRSARLVVRILEYSPDASDDAQRMRVTAEVAQLRLKLFVQNLLEFAQPHDRLIPIAIERQVGCPEPEQEWKSGNTD